MTPVDDKLYLRRKGDLKPCPFCGGRAYEYVENGAIYIKCHFSAESAARAGCGAILMRYLVPPGAWTEAVDSCRAAWNRRPSDAPVDDVD